MLYYFPEAKMKKIIIRVLLILLALLLTWVVAHRFDAAPAPDLFSLSDIPPASFENDNGFYFLWSLIEPPEIDIAADSNKQKYRQLFDPQLDNEKYLEAFDFDRYRQVYQEKFLPKYKQIGIDAKGLGAGKDWCQEARALKSHLSPLAPEMQVLYGRFRLMIDSPVFEDFIPPKADAPLPNLLAWLHAAKLYTSVNVLTAIEGDWEKGVSNLLDTADFAKRAVKGSRVVIINLIGKAIIQLSLQAIGDVMNQPDCPVSVYELVLKRTPPMTYEEFGTRQSMICEVVGFTFDFIDRPFVFKEDEALHFNSWEKIMISLFLRKNSTKNYANEYMKQFIQLEQTPPYQWQSPTIRLQPIKKGPFWWLWNAGGKILLATYAGYPPDTDSENWLYAVLFKAYAKKALYDMVRISAELHLKYTPDKPVPEILAGLEAYKILDACSGQPYRWNEEKQVLYSIGTDRQDNGGETHNYERITGVDVALPVILYVK